MSAGKTMIMPSLREVANPAAGHEGAMEDEDREVFVKPCTQAEIDFYQASMTSHPKFYEMMPDFMGTLTLGESDQVADAIAASAELSQTADNQQPPVPADPASRRHKIITEVAVVLEHLEHGFSRPNVLDIKLGSKLYAPDTRPDKAQRLDKVSAETTSGSLHFRCAGMKVWEGEGYRIYDKVFGRSFTPATVRQVFELFFGGLQEAVSKQIIQKADARLILETILADITKTQHSLERSESRMYGASLLIVFEADHAVLRDIIAGASVSEVSDKAPNSQEWRANAEDDEEDEDDPPVISRVRMIDFAHSTWTPDQGPDLNVIKGLQNVVACMDELIALYDD